MDCSLPGFPVLPYLPEFAQTHVPGPTPVGPRDGEPGGLPSMGSHRVGHNRIDLAAAATSLIITEMQISTKNVHEEA